MADPLTIRYNNPGALEFKPWMEKHGARLGPNGRYAAFDTPDQGYGVMSKVLDTYGNKHGLTSVSGIVNRWAPPNVDNNSTGDYIRRVSSSLGIDPISPVPPERRADLMRAMAEVEAGRAPAAFGSAPTASSPTSPISTTGAAPTMARTSTGWTPESVDFAKKFGAGQMKEGIDSSPVGHWTQAIARVLQAGSGAAWNQQGLEAEREGNKRVSDIYANGLANNEPVPRIAASLMGDDFGRQEGQSIAKSVIAQRVKGPEQTEAQKNFMYGQNNPDFAKREIELKQAARPQTTIDMKGETTFSSESSKSLVKRLTENVEQGQAARTQQGDLDRLSELGSAIGTQGAAAQVKAALGPYANALGIQIDGLNEIQAFTGIVSKLAPTMRPPGSGATSDFEFKQYLAALPQLAQTTEGRKLILDQMGAMINYKASVGEISERVLAGEIDRKQADVEIRKIGNPLSLWRKGPQALAPSTPAAPQQPGQAPIVQMGNQIIEQGKQLIQSGQIDPQAVMESAQKAIAAGADPAVVQKRVQELLGQQQQAPATQSVQQPMRGKLNYRPRPQEEMPNG